MWLWKDEYTEELIKQRAYEYKNQNKNKSRGAGGDSVSAKQVEQLDPITNEVINTFSCIKEAKSSTGNGNIGATCRGERDTANGFKWRYKQQ